MPGKRVARGYLEDLWFDEFSSKELWVLARRRTTFTFPWDAVE